MKGYLLDTSICVFLLRGKRSIEEKLNEIDESDCYITDAVVAELIFGAYLSQSMKPFIHLQRRGQRSGRPERKSMTLTFLSEVQPKPKD